MSERVDLQEFRGAFVVEAEELLATANTSLLDIEAAIRDGTSRPRAVRDLFRALHTIKGLASMIGVLPIVEIAHALETLVRSAERAGGVLDGAAVEIALQAVGAIGERVQAVGDARVVAPAPALLVDQIDELAASEAVVPAPMAQIALPPAWEGRHDNPTEALMAEHSLGATYDFERFVDGSVIVERLASGALQPDLVLLDWVMPGMAGDEVCRFLRTDPRTIELPIILITSSRTETVDVADGLASGANDYVARPFATEELRARVDSAIRTKRLGDLAQQERRRLSTINQLGSALFEAGPDIPRILDQLAISLTMSLCDGCSVLMLPGGPSTATVSRHRAEPSGERLASISRVADPYVYAFASSTQARASLPPAYGAYIDRFGLRGLAILPFTSRDHLRGVVTATRDDGSLPFDDDDLLTIKTCIEYASIAVEGALRFEAERAADLLVNAERERIAHFQQEMLGIVGHDLRAPLAAIRIGTEMLAAKGDLGAENIVKRIDSSTNRMMRMIDQLLDMTRLRLGGGIPVARQRTPLVPIIKSVIDELAMAHEAACFELVVDADVVGQWDPDRLGQVASNLLGNAVQYGRAGARIRVELAAANGSAIMTVHNENRGDPIRADRIATLFDPYRRGDDNERNSNGLGLGLYIASDIVHAHGGTIDVESTATGTTFRVVLPESG